MGQVRGPLVHMKDMGFYTFREIPFAKPLSDEWPNIGPLCFATS